MTKFLLLGMAGGFIAGAALTFVLYKTRSIAGTLKIDHSNPNKDAYLFEIDDLDSLSRKKRVVLKVDNDARLSQN